MRSFTGRELDLTAVRDGLGRQQGSAVVPAVALHGIGGIGKTQLARAYAHKHRQLYELGWWIPAENPLNITATLGELAVRLGSPVDLPAPQLLARLHQILADRGNWLLIFDNAASPAQLEQFLPIAGAGHLLVTSRYPAWQGLAATIPIDLLPLDPAARLLCERTSDPDRRAAEELANVLGRLPLAIEQAAAYATEQHLRLANYLDLFQQRRAELLARGQPLAYQGTVATTVTLIIDHLKATAPASVHLLELCALFAPDELPIHQILTVPDSLTEPMATAARDPITRRELVGALYGAGLLTPDVDDTVRLHQLIQAVVVHRMAERKQRVIDAITVLADLFPVAPWDEPATWPVCARLLPHAQAVFIHAHEQHVETNLLAGLLSTVGRYILRRGLGLTDAYKLSEQALAMRQRLYQGDHPDIARTLNAWGAQTHAWP